MKLLIRYLTPLKKDLFKSVSLNKPLVFADISPDSVENKKIITIIAMVNTIFM